MGSLRKLVGELRESMMWLDAPVPSDGVMPNIANLASLVNEMEDNAELKKLSPEEMRAFEGFRITLHKAMHMEPGTAAQHVLTHWTQAKQSVLTLSIGRVAEQLVSAIEHGCGCT